MSGAFDLTHRRARSRRHLRSRKLNPRGCRVGGGVLSAFANRDGRRRGPGAGATSNLRFADAVAVGVDMRRQHDVAGAGERSCHVARCLSTDAAERERRSEFIPGEDNRSYLAPAINRTLDLVPLIVLRAAAMLSTYLRGGWPRIPPPHPTPTQPVPVPVPGRRARAPRSHPPPASFCRRLCFRLYRVDGETMSSHTINRIQVSPGSVAIRPRQQTTPRIGTTGTTASGRDGRGPAASSAVSTRRRRPARTPVTSDVHELPSSWRAAARAKLTAMPVKIVER